MATIRIDVWLYGPLARYGREAASKTHANLQVELPTGSTVRDLLIELSLPTEERGLTFINGDLSAMPGHQPDLDHPLADSDRVAFFHLNSMWPAQYRDGVKMASEMEQTMQEKGTFHHKAKD